jgi:hypothetical protein
MSVAAFEMQLLHGKREAELCGAYTYPNSIELPSYEALVLKGLFHRAAQFEHWKSNQIRPSCGDLFRENGKGETNSACYLIPRH